MMPTPRDLRLADLVLEPRVFVQDHRPELRRINSVYGLISLLRSLPRLERVVEIGSFRGISTEVFLLFAAQVIAVDPWRGLDALYQAFLQRVTPYPHLQVVRDVSIAAVARFPAESFDLVYIDGQHDYGSVKADLRAWLPKVRKGGWIAGHDYSSQIDNGDVIRAVNEVLGAPQAVFEDSSWLFRLPE
jgi:predicted O-methyltransferase YrrM